MQGDVEVDVTGVGFFDFAHGQVGLAKNCVELHPVLDINFTRAGPFEADCGALWRASTNRLRNQWSSLPSSL